MATPARYKPRVKVKLDLYGGVIGPGKAELLRRIDAVGSISAAAREMGINYRRAWFLLETLSDPLGRPVVETVKGGAAGGGALLSETGRTVLEAYDTCVRAADLSTADIVKELHRALGRKPATRR